MNPTFLNRYTHLTTLAENADAQTYQAKDEQTQQTVVLKRLQLGKTNSWKRLELFQREAKVLASLHHPHIPRLLDFFKEETEQGLNAYLINEWIEGEPLAQKIEQHWMPDEATLLDLARQILWTLSYLHRFNPPVVHRDVKPSNLILNDDGKVFLIDFGGAQELLQPMGGGGSTVIGTFGYMAPEQFAGRAVPATDLYGLGASLIHLLSGRSPSNMPQKNMQIMFQGMVHGSGGLIRWITQLIRPTVEDRYKTADIALRQLEELTALPHVKAPETDASSPPLSPSLLNLLATPLGTYSERTNEASHLLQPGDFIKGYEIETLLTCGTHTVSYFAKHPHTQKSVFVKSIHFQSQTVWKGLELFEREIEALQRLNHHGIPHFIETFKTESQDFYLVTEKITGQNLAQKQLTGWRPTEAEVIDIAQQALTLLENMHAQKPAVIHRDIKPSNLMLDTEGKLYLIDFGGVQAHFQTQGTGGSTVIGTYGYIAPEEFLKKAVPATDLYSLGVTLVRLLSGHEPTTIPQKDLRLHFRPLLNCSEALINWLEDMTEPDLLQRFRSAKQAKELLLTLTAQKKLPLPPVKNTAPITTEPTVFKQMGSLLMRIDPVTLKPAAFTPHNKKELVDAITTQVAHLKGQWKFNDMKDNTSFQMPILSLSWREYRGMKRHLNVKKQELPGYVSRKERKKLTHYSKKHQIIKREELIATAVTLTGVPGMFTLLLWPYLSSDVNASWLPLYLTVFVVFLMVLLPLLTFILTLLALRDYLGVRVGQKAILPGLIKLPEVPIKRAFAIQEHSEVITVGFSGEQIPWKIHSISCEKVIFSDASYLKSIFILTISTSEKEIPLLFEDLEEAQLMADILHSTSNIAPQT